MIEMYCILWFIEYFTCYAAVNENIFWEKIYFEFQLVESAVRFPNLGGAVLDVDDASNDASISVRADLLAAPLARLLHLLPGHEDPSLDPVSLHQPRHPRHGRNDPRRHAVADLSEACLENQRRAQLGKVIHFWKIHFFATFISFYSQGVWWGPYLVSTHRGICKEITVNFVPTFIFKPTWATCKERSVNSYSKTLHPQKTSLLFVLPKLVMARNVSHVELFYLLNLLNIKFLHRK